MNLKIKLGCKKFLELLKSARYKMCYGGRGGGKSWAIVLILLALSFKKKLRILCCREIQKSIKDSVYRLIEDSITRYGLNKYFSITDKYIKNLITGSVFFFEGLRNNTNNIMSYEGIDICYVEQAEKVSSHSWEILTPTIRKDGSEIWAVFNRDEDDDPVYEKFVKNKRDNTIIVNVNYYDNMYFPEVLKQEVEYDKANDIDKYNHKWLGYPKKHSNAQIFKGKWIVEDFETPEEVNFYHGLDFGFSPDPNAFIRCFIIDGILYIDQEMYQAKQDIDEIPESLKAIETAKRWKIYGDCSRPETISYLRKNGINVIGCKKWKGCVEDGIERIRAFRKIVIHPRCKHAIDEFTFYRRKTDKLTGKILPLILDENNHLIDALRYAIQDIITFKRANVVRRGW